MVDTLTGLRQTDFLILDRLTNYDIITLCQSGSARFKILCNERNFNYLISKRFLGTLNFKPEHLTWQQYFIRVVNLSERMFKLFGDYFVAGDPEIVDKIILVGSRSGPDAGLIQAAKHGYTYLVLRYIRQGGKASKTAVRQAYLNDHIELAKTLNKRLGPRDQFKFE